MLPEPGGPRTRVGLPGFTISLTSLRIAIVAFLVTGRRSILSKFSKEFQATLVRVGSDQIAI